MVKLQLELSDYHDNIIRKLIIKGVHKTKAEAIRTAITFYGNNELREP
jgi:Arc/MetJ-type ribon-helix-helix transcriptional regulator